MNHIIAFDQGKIVGDGAHQDLLNESEMYKSLWNGNQVGGSPAGVLGTFSDVYYFIVSHV